MTSYSEPNTILEINEVHSNNFMLVIPNLPTAYFLSSTFHNVSSPFQSVLTPQTTASSGDGCGNGPEWDQTTPVTNPSTTGSSGCSNFPDVCNETPRQADRRVQREINQDWRNFRLYLSECTLPQVSVNKVVIPTQFADMSRAGKISFGDFTSTMMISENLLNYNAILYWLYGLANPEEYNKMSGRGMIETFFTDIHLIIKNNHKEKVAEYKFIDAFPTSISQLDLTVKEANNLNANVTWAYSGMVPSNNYVLKFV